MSGIIYADADVAMSAFFGEQSNSLKEYLGQSVQRFVQAVSPAARGIAARLEQTYHDYRYGETARRVEALRNEYQHSWKSEGIYAHTNLGSLQQCSHDTRRFIMAEPRTRRLHQQARCASYGEDYIDSSPTGVGPGHYDYRVATNGLLIQQGEDEDRRYITRQFFETTKEEYSLNIYQKAAIELTWETQRRLIDEGMLDFTSQENELLG